MSKTVLKVFVLLLIVVGMATPSSAFVVRTEVENMTLGTCDRAGTIRYEFEQSDWENIRNYLKTQEEAQIKVFLRGEEFTGTKQPTVCSGINSYLRYYLPNQPGELQDVSSYLGGAWDVNVKVEAVPGEDFILIRIQKPFPAIDPDWGGKDIPWFRVGLMPTADQATDDTHICASTEGFTINSKLIVLNKGTPDSLQFSGEDRIGTFSGSEFSCLNCPPQGKGSSCIADTSIQLCPIEDQQDCDTYKECARIVGQWPSTSEDYTIEITTNPLVDKVRQTGVFFSSVTLADFETPTKIIAPKNVVYYDANGTPLPQPLPNCGFQAVRYVATVSGASLDGIKQIRACIEFTVNPDDAVAGTTVNFGFVANAIPCGTLFDLLLNSNIILNPCAAGCLYFPYVVQQSPGWITGIAITKLADLPSLAESVLTMTLTDSKGNKFQWVKQPLANNELVFVFKLDDELNNFKPLGSVTTPEKGPGWLKVKANYPVDGYEFIQQTGGSQSFSNLLPRFCKDTKIDDR